MDLFGTPATMGRNRLINGNFAVNQRGYASSGALGAGQYAHDRWKDFAGGTSYTFTQGTPDTLITITQGVLAQVIDPVNMEGGTFTLSWAGTVQMQVQYRAAGSTADVYSPLGPSPQTCAGIPAGATVIVATVGTGTLGLVQFELGVSATIFERRHIALETVFCQRYFQKQNGLLYGFVTTNNSIAVLWNSNVPMRSSPSVALNASSIYIESPPFVTGYNTSSASLNGAHNYYSGSFDIQISGFSGLTISQVASLFPGALSISAEL